MMSLLAQFHRSLIFVFVPSLCAQVTMTGRTHFGLMCHTWST